MEKKWRRKKMNYYEVLRVPTTATLSDIKNAYKKLVKKYHPDIYEGNKIFAESKIKEINEAYETLSEKNKKEMYDAELNYKKYEPTKEDYVKTYTRDDLNQYKKAYYSTIKTKVKKKEKVEVKNKKKLIDLNAIGKKYFFKLDEKISHEDKEDFLILVLLFVIIFACMGIAGLVI